MENLKVCFWGKIYNETELKKEIGISKDCSTEELIKHSFKLHGIDFLKKLEGGYVGGIEDIVKNTYYLFRDKLGIRNIYYAKFGDNLIYDISLEEVYKKTKNTTINIQALYDYMTLFLVPGRDTLHTDIFKVRAGCYTRIDNADITEHKYWDATELIRNGKNLNRISNDRSIKLNLRESLTDVMATIQKPVGLLLSDGIDSNLIAELLNDIKDDFNAYTIVSSKSAYKDRIERRIHELKITKVNMIPFQKTNILDFLSSLDEPYPFTDIYIIEQLLQNICLDGINICMTGEGADELGGYQEYIRMAKVAQNLNARRGKYETTYNGKYVSGRHITGFTEYEKTQLFTMSNRCESSYRVIYGMMYEIDGETIEDMYYKFLNLDMNLRLPELLLHRLDIVSKQFNVDLVFPFLGIKVVEEILQQPRAVMIEAGTVKKAFRTILSDYVKTNNYSKMGLGETYTEELAGLTRKLYASELSENIKEQPICDFVRPNFIKTIMDRNDRKSWLLFSLNHWLKGRY